MEIVDKYNNTTGNGENYFALVEKKQYDKMYDMLSESSKEKYQKRNLQNGIRIFTKESRQKISKSRSLKGETQREPGDCEIFRNDGNQCG